MEPSNKSRGRKKMSKHNEKSACHDHKIISGDDDNLQELFIHLFDTLAVGVTVWSTDGRLLTANKGFVYLTGYNPEEIDCLDHWVKEAFPDKDSREQILRQRKNERFERDFLAVHQFICKGGEQKDFECCSSRLGDGRVVVIIAGISESKKIREENLKRKQFLESVLYHAPDAIVTLDARHRVLDWNPGAVDVFGYLPEETIGRNLDDLVAPGEEQFVEARQKTKEVLAGKRVEPFETVRYRKDGSPVRVIAGGSPIIVNGELIGVVAVYTDITKRVEAEEALKRSETRFRTLVEHLPLGIVLISNDDQFIYANPAVEEDYGFKLKREQDPGGVLKAAFPDEAYRKHVIDLWERQLNLAAQGKSEPQVLKVTCANGSVKHMHARLIMITEFGDRIIACEDISEKIKLEVQFQQAQKFEALGTLAGGIAHDFNNILMGIQGLASIVKMNLEAGNPNREYMRAIEDYVRSASSLTSQLLGLAKGGKYEVKNYDINKILADSAEMFGRTRKQVRVHKDLYPQPLVVALDKAQIQQVFLNIFVNAWQAMPEGGDIFVVSTRIILDEREARIYQFAPGRYAKISITDTGEGMDEAIRQRIFDPFFTTKDKGRGTGLGLASAYGIINNHGGNITVYSEPGQGATFNIYLPLSGKEADRGESVGDSTVKGGGTILLVDDEEMILSVGRLMLEKLGYKVITASSGAMALDKIHTCGEQINLVVLDMIMPIMDGGKVFEMIREQYPDMPVLLSSGYSVNGQAMDILDRGCDGFIQKPFTVNDLSSKIQSCLRKRK